MMTDMINMMIIIMTGIGIMMIVIMTGTGDTLGDHPLRTTTTKETGIGLYRGFFDLDLKSDPYWYNRLLEGISFKHFVREMIFILKKEKRGPQYIAVEHLVAQIAELTQCYVIK